MERVDSEQLTNLLYGATALGSGGGGGFGATQEVRDILLKLQQRTRRDLKMVTLDELNDTDTTFNVAAIGKPSEMQNVDYMDSILRVAKTYVNATTNRQPDVMMCGETGVNTFVAMLAAVALDVPIIDGDSAGRAMPTLGGSLYTANGLPYSPAAVANLIADGSGRAKAQTIVRGDTIDAFQKDIRKTISTPEYGGGVATFATWGASGADLKLRGAYVGQPTVPGAPYSTVCAGSISFAMRLGYRIRQYLDSDVRHSVVGMVNAMNEAFRHEGNEGSIVRVLASGPITKIDHPGNQQGFDFGNIFLHDRFAPNGRIVEMRYLNETITVRDTTLDRHLCMYPDIISYLDKDLRPTTNSDGLMAGDELTVLSIPARQVFKHGEDPTARQNLEDAGRQVRERVGYSGAYVPVEPSGYRYP